MKWCYSLAFLGCVGLTLGLSQDAPAAELVSLKNVVDPGPNRPDEPLATEFSMANAFTFLDSAALTWQKNRKCFTCHTNYAHLYARPAESADDASALEVRAFAEELITRRWVENGPRWDAEIVATGGCARL